MLERLNQHKTRKTFTKYESSVNELYNMFREMNNKTMNDITVFEKADELDRHYGTIKTMAPTKYIGIRRIIISEYSKFNIDYRKSKQPKNTFTQQFVNDELAKEDCKLICTYINSNEYITYTYNDKKYKCTFNQWRNYGYRPHLNYYPGAHR